MAIFNFTEARSSLKKVMDQVIHDDYFSTHAWVDYLYWQDQNPEKLKKFNMLIKEVNRQPFKDIGKPKALKGDHQRMVVAAH